MHYVALCQMCVAFGLVYLGLKEARYRIRTYEAIASGIKVLAGIDFGSQAYLGLLKDKPRFAEYHHMIADLIGILPPKYRVDMTESQDRLLEDRESTAKLRLFNFFNSNWDNWIVFASSVLLPMLIMSVLHFAPPVPHGTVSSTGAPLALSILIISAMAPPGLFAILGMRMYLNMEIRIIEAANYISSAYAEALADTVRPKDAIDTQ